MRRNLEHVVYEFSNKRTDIIISKLEKPKGLNITEIMKLDKEDRLKILQGPDLDYNKSWVAAQDINIVKERSVSEWRCIK